MTLDQTTILFKLTHTSGNSLTFSHTNSTSGTYHTLVPQEAMEIFILPKPHSNQSVSNILTEPVLLDFNFALEASESITEAILDMRVEYVGEIVASFL